MRRSGALADLRALSGPTVIAMAIGTLVVVLDGAVAGDLDLIALLAIAPVVASISASTPETGVVGAFCLAMAALSGLWNHNFVHPDHLVSMLVVASGSVAGLWTATLRERLERGRAAEAMLAEVGTLLEDELDRSRRAQHIARIAVPRLGDAVAVDLLRDDGVIERAAIASVDRSSASAVTHLRRRTPIDPEGPNPVAEVIRTGRELFVKRFTDPIDEIRAGRAEADAVRRRSPNETIIAPLRARGMTVGAITVSLFDSQRHYDDEARRVVRALAERCALAIDNARVHEEQAHIASVLQRSLLPESLPEIAGFETASRFLAAGEANQVGGDFYDVFRSGRDSWTVVIGDVCGKGPEAAALTALARHTIRAAESPRSPPSAVLARLHDSIKESDPERRFCTAVLARVEAANATTRVRLTLGGHPPPLAVRSDGSVEPVGRPGTLLGGLDEPDLADATTELAAGEALVLFTDGLLEVRDRTLDRDPSWPAGVLARANGRTAERIAADLLDEALARQGGEPRDDIAIVVLRRTP